MKKILVVEGRRPIEGLSGALFRRRECVLEVASSAAEALASMENDPPALVLLDAEVDDFTAEELIEATASTGHGGVSVIVVLPEDSALDEGRLLRCGASAVLRRPTDEIDLNVKVCEALGISLRRHLRTFVKLKVDATIGTKTHFATISNISLGGVQVETGETLSAGDFIKLQFFLPGDDEAITAIVRVVRQAGDRGYGCQFLDLTDAARERIHEFVTEASGDE